MLTKVMNLNDLLVYPGGAAQQMSPRVALSSAKEVNSYLSLITTVGELYTCSHVPHGVQLHDGHTVLVRLYRKCALYSLLLNTDMPLRRGRRNRGGISSKTPRRQVGRALEILDASRCANCINLHTSSSQHATHTRLPAGSHHLKTLAQRPLLVDAHNLVQPSTVVSPLIYGGFIEHLGRCIYGGIVDDPKTPSPEDLLVRQRGDRLA